MRWDGFGWVKYAQSADYQDVRPEQRPNEWIEASASGATTYYGVTIKRYRSDRMLNADGARV